jgi:hypothetical protein
MYGFGNLRYKIAKYHVREYTVVNLVIHRLKSYLAKVLPIELNDSDAIKVISKPIRSKSPLLIDRAC